jgi:hypothetical protein
MVRVCEMCGLGHRDCGGPRELGKYIYNFSLGIASYYLIKPELRSGFDFQYSQKPYRYQLRTI